MSKDQLSELLAKYKAGTCTEQEKALLENWVTHTRFADFELSEPDMEADLDRIARSMPFHRRTRPLWPRIAAAASIILALSAGGYFLLHPSKPAQFAQNDPENIRPLQKGVTLSIGGQRIAIRRGHQGAIANHLGVAVSQQDSLISYQSDQQAGPVEQVLANNGNEPVTVQLPDGTKATIDINSALTYPSRFTGKARDLQASGQVYFAVHHDPARPFRVHYAGQVSEDIGTEFNVRAYADETVRTTLIAGAIKVNDKILKPGEQATQNGHSTTIRTVKLEDVTAWLQQQLVFHHETLENIMLQISRIYGVVIDWQDQEVKDIHLGAAFSRKAPLSSVLNYVRKVAKVDFKVEGKTVRVMKRI